MINIKNERKKKLVKLLLTIVIIIIIYFIQLSSEEEPQQNLYTEGDFFVHMIDVGQADSFLLIQNGEVALVDCGTRSTGKDVVGYLKSLGITKIDYLFGTHPHDDHMGGMYDVITNFEIGKIIIPKVKSGTVTSNWYMKLMEEIKQGDYIVEYPIVGTTYNLGDTTIKIIGPITQEVSNINNYSTVLKVSFGMMDIIMTGDAEKEVELDIIKSGENLDAEILKVGHHGSNTSSSEEFLDAVNPEYALISTKVGNKYEHPIKSVMDSLKERKVEVYRTDECGTVILTITSDDVSFNTKPGDYLSGVELEERKAK